MDTELVIKPLLSDYSDIISLTDSILGIMTVIVTLILVVKRETIKRKLPPLNTPERIMKRAKKRLGDWYVVEKDGRIVFRPPPGAELDIHLPNFRKPLLYIFAARDAYDMGRRKTPKVSYYELSQTVGWCESEFLSSREISVYDVDSVELDCEKGTLVVNDHKEAFEVEAWDYEKEVIEIDELDYKKEMNDLEGDKRTIYVVEMEQSVADDIASYIERG